MHLERREAKAQVIMYEQRGRVDMIHAFNQHIGKRSTK